MVLIRDCHSLPATARVALKMSAVLVSCRLCPEVTVVLLLAGRRETHAAWTFCWLIVLQLNDQASLSLCGSLEGFF